MFVVSKSVHQPGWFFADKVVLCTRFLPLVFGRHQDMHVERTVRSLNEKHLVPPLHFVCNYCNTFRAQKVNAKIDQGLKFFLFLFFLKQRGRKVPCLKEEKGGLSLENIQLLESCASRSGTGLLSLNRRESFQLSENL